MPVNTPHPSYTENAPIWLKCRHAIEGEDTVKGQGDLYLPRLSGMDDNDYRGYLERATFYGAAQRTVKGLSGMVTRKDPKVEFPQKELLETIGCSGEPLQLVGKCVLEEVLSIGRVGVYVDAPDFENALPYIAVYYAENIINWRVEEINGKDQLTLVVLKEMVEKVNPEDEFQTDIVEQYRVLRLSTPPIDGDQAGQPAVDTDALVYTVEVWRKFEVGGDPRTGEQPTEEWRIDSQVTPRARGGRTLNYIPFIFISPDGITPEIAKSPVLDLVNLNMSHYRTSADLEHGRHFTALPTAWAAGFDPEVTRLRIGSSVAWISDNPQARCGFLEFTGAGLEHLANALVEKERQMAVLGARLLEEQKKEAEAATTVLLRQSGEKSVLASVTEAVSDGITRALQWCLDFLGTPSATASFELNKDFNVTSLDPAMLEKLMLAYQSNAISYDVWFYNLKRGEIFPDDHDIEKEKALLQAGGPVPPVGTLLDNDDSDEE